MIWSPEITLSRECIGKVWSAAKNRPQNQHFPANAERIVTGPLFKMSYNDTVCIDFQIMFIKLDPWADFNFPDGSQFFQFVESGTRWAFVTWQMNENTLFVAPKHFLLLLLLRWCLSLRNFVMVQELARKSRQLPKVCVNLEMTFQKIDSEAMSNLSNICHQFYLDIWPWKFHPLL